MLFYTLFVLVGVVHLTTAAGIVAPCVEELAYQNVFVSPLNQYTSSDCNIICFGDFYAGTGDVEGRLCVGGSVNLGNGFSIGYMLWTSGSNATDRPLPWSLVVGNDMNWGSGGLFPDGSNSPFPGAREGMYVGGTVTAPSYLASRQTGGPCEGCLDAAFESAYTYFSNVSAVFAAAPTNAQATFMNDGIFLTSADPSATRYYLQIDADIFNEATYWSMTNMNSLAVFIVTITGEDDVYFEGGDFVGTPNQVVFNIPGTRDIYVESNASGHILAPDCTLMQTGGDEIGLVIVDQVEKFVESIKPNCTSQVCCQWCSPGDIVEWW